MPDTGNPYYLPYATLSDETDANKYLRQLAEAQHAAIDQPIPRSARWKTTGQTIPVINTWYTITFEGVEPLPQNSVPIPYSAGIWTIERAGVYQVDFSAHLQGVVGSQWRVGLSAPGNACVPIISGPNNTNAFITKSWRIAAGASLYVQAYVNNISGATVYGHASQRHSYIDISWITS